MISRRPTPAHYQAVGRTDATALTWAKGAPRLQATLYHGRVRRGRAASPLYSAERHLIEHLPTITTEIKPPTPTPEASRPNWRRPGLTGLVGLLLLAPLGLDLWFINAYGVNVPFADSWNGTLPFVKEYVTGHLQLAQLWAPHNENRMLFPNLILALVDSHDRVNSVVDMYLTAAIMAASLTLLLWLARRSSRIPLVWLLPVPFIFFSLA